MATEIDGTWQEFVSTIQDLDNVRTRFFTVLQIDLFLEKNNYSRKVSCYFTRSMLRYFTCDCWLKYYSIYVKLLFDK